MLTPGKWTKSTRSNTTGSCVEVRPTEDGAVQVRNSRHPDGPVNTFTAAEWAAFVEGVRAGEFDL